MILRSRHIRWCIITVVAFALAIHGVLPVAMASQSAMASPAPGSLEAALQVICTGHGAKDQVPGTPVIHDCQACSAPSAAPALPQADTLIDAPVPIRQAQPCQPAVSALAQVTRSDFDARGPPAAL